VTAEWWVIPVVLVAALSHATWNAFVKSSADRLFTMTTLMATSGLIYSPVLFLVDFPVPAAWPFLLASVVLHIGYNVGLVWAYKHGDLSTAYPIARGSSPMMVALGAWVFAGEALSPLAFFGISLVSCGISMFAFERGLPRGEHLKPFGIAILVAMCIASYTVVDGSGLRLTSTPFSYIAWHFVLDAFPLLTWALVTRRDAYLAHFRRWWKRDMTGGLFSALAYSLVLFVMSFSGMASVSALRETSVLFAVAIGAIKLQETFGLYRWTAAFVVTAGVIIMQIGG